MAQVDLHNLIEESQLDFAKGRGYVYPQFYLNSRANIKGFEKMKIKGKKVTNRDLSHYLLKPILDILQKLISRQNEVIKFRKDEGLLGSDQESH
jgi:hypothetical protein